eukprot:TRINITY_DN7256_c0_g4_i1.p1 TRINITY_DN7256_c0_g4~~TRINITY_DN7256_c0_g4_i1.p1  ORF type:complete len:884 (+),score=112.79 TRINITY_DN7256_c0_g4_i1:54-2654(+)
MGVVEDIVAQHTEGEEEAGRRSAALELVSRCFKEWSGDYSSQVVVFGSVALGVHLEGADTDLVCVTSSPKAHNFFRSFPGYLRSRPGVRSVHHVPAMPPLIEAVVHGIHHDILFCFVPLPTPLPPHINLSDNRYLLHMDDVSRRSIGGPRLIGLLYERVPNMNSFKTALKAIKIWAAHRGLHGARYGYPGGATWAAMMCFTARRCPWNASPATLVSSFFQLFEGSGMNYPISILDEVHGWAKGPGDHMAVLVPFPTPPGTRTQMINTCPGSVCTVKSLRAEIDRAAFLCKIPGRMEAVWNKADFFSSFPQFVVLEVRTISKELLDRWVGFVSANVKELLALLDHWAKDREKTDLWPYPYFYRTDFPEMRLFGGKPSEADENGDFAGYFFVGLRTELSMMGDTESASLARWEAEGLVKSAEPFITLCSDWHGRLEGMFEPSISVVEPDALPGFVLDNPVAGGKGKREKTVRDVVRNFERSGVEGVDGAVMMKVKEDCVLEWMPGAGEGDSIPKGTIVMVRAIDGDEETAWVRTETGNEGFVKTSHLIDYAMATLNPPQTPATPLTPSTTFMKTKSETRLRAFPLPAPQWVEGEDAIIPEGAIVAVRALDDEGEYALVRYDKAEGFISTKHLKADASEGHWINCTRAKELKNFITKAKETGDITRMGALTALEQTLVESQPGVSVGRFNGEWYCWVGDGAGGGFPMSPPGVGEGEVLFSGIQLHEESVEALKEFFQEKGLIPATWEIRCETVFLKTGPLNDPHTEGQDHTFYVVATGSTPTTITAGILNCHMYTVSPTPHVVVATNPHSDSRYAPNITKATWDLLPASDILTLSGTLTQYYESDGYDLTTEQTFEDVTDPYEGRLSFG